MPPARKRYRVTAPNSDRDDERYADNQEAINAALEQSKDRIVEVYDDEHDGDEPLLLARYGA